MWLYYRNERKKYHLHREKARANPNRYITIIIDGMDQSKTNLPSMVQEAKSTQNLFRLRTHLTGALVHTRSPHGKHIFAFYDMLQWAHDSNMTIQVLSQVVHSFRDKLPPTLYLQLDNCGHENKNRYLLGYCALLVSKDVFTKVAIYRLVYNHYSIHGQLFYCHTDTTQLSSSGPYTWRCGPVFLQGITKTEKEGCRVFFR